jgi:hypothetical protein
MFFFSIYIYCFICIKKEPQTISRLKRDVVRQKDIISELRKELIDLEKKKTLT